MNDIQMINEQTNQNNLMPYNQHPSDFEEVEGGMYDHYGCYIYPDGSFLDPNGVFFNKDGLDSNGGFYDEDFHYHPGQNWNEDLQCYMNNNNELPSEYQQTLVEGMQSRLSEDYDMNRALFKNDENKNFTYEDTEMGNNMDIYEPNDMINSFVEGNLIQGGNMERQENFGSAMKEPLREITNFVSSGNIETPFKTKTSDLLKQGSAFQPYSMKKDSPKTNQF